MQWWMNAVDYQLIISGKPIFSLPANIPVIFESTVLLAGVTAFLCVLVLNMLPEHYHPLFSVEKFKKATGDGFFVAIDASDPLFDQAKTTAVLKAAGAKTIDLVMGEKPSTAQLPRFLIYGGLILVVATFLPLALFANARVSKSREPKLHLVFDMDHQPKVKTQASSKFFENGQGYRPPLEGTVAVGNLRDDDHFDRGVVNGAWATELPTQVDASEGTMTRGQQRFGIYCAPCHGLAGGGDGPVARRASELGESKWVPPTNLTSAAVRAQPIGQLFNTVTHGVRNMPAYGAQIPVADRWAILMYVQALQRSQYAQLNDVPADVQPTLH
jgi:mono/diheme cytochrome c family protein